MVNQCQKCGTIVKLGEEELHICTVSGDTTDPVPEGAADYISLMSINANLSRIQNNARSETRLIDQFDNYGPDIRDINCMPRTINDRNRPIISKAMRNCYSMPCLSELEESLNTRSTQCMHGDAHARLTAPPEPRRDKQNTFYLPNVTFLSVQIDETDPDNKWQLGELHADQTLGWEYSGPVEFCQEYVCSRWEFQVNDQFTANPDDWWRMIAQYSPFNNPFKRKPDIKQLFKPEIESKRLFLPKQVNGCMVVFKISAWNKTHFKLSLSPIKCSHNYQIQLRSVTFTLKLEIHSRCSRRKIEPPASVQCRNSLSFFSHTFTITQIGENAFPDNFLIPLKDLGILMPRFVLYFHPNFD